MILVVGGTGVLGRRLVPLLTGSGRQVRVVARGQPSDSIGRADGVESAIADVRDPVSLDRVMAGVDTVVSAVQGFGGPNAAGAGPVDRDGNVNLIDSAIRAGVSRVVLLSVTQAAPDHPMELFRMKYAAEQHLRASGMDWTIIRPTAYMETWLEIVGRPLVETGRAMIFGRGENAINFVSADDVAGIVHLAAVDPANRGMTIEAPGPDNVTFLQLIRTVADASGRDARVRHIPRPVMRVAASGLRRLKPVLAGQIQAALVMDTIDMTADVTDRAKRFPSVPLTRLRTVAERQVAEWKAGDSGPMTS